MTRALRFTWGLLVLSCALLACSPERAPKMDASGPAPAPAVTPTQPALDGGHRVGAVSPSGTGFPLVQGGLQLPYALGPSPLVQDAASQYPPLLATGSTYCDAGICWVSLTSDMIAPAFSVSLTLASGGGTFEVGQTGSPCNPVYNASPTFAGGTIQGSSPWADNQGHNTTINAASGMANPNGGAYASLTSTGTITATITETQISPPVTKSAGPTTGCTFLGRWFFGPASDTAPNTGTYTLSQSAGNATLGNAGGGTVSGSLTGSLTSFSTSSTFQVTTAVGQYAVIVTPHSGTVHTFNYCAPTPCTPLVSMPVNEVRANYSATNQYATAFAVDIYESQASLGAVTGQVSVTQ